MTTATRTGHPSRTSDRRPNRFSRFLVAVDDSDSASRGADTVAVLAEATGAELVVFSAAERELPPLEG